MNDTLARIKKKIVDPELGKLRNSVRGYVSVVYYQDRCCDVVYFDSDGAMKKKKRIPFPEEESGLYKESIHAGDRVELAFRTKTDTAMHIAAIYPKEKSRQDFALQKGLDAPVSTELF